MLKIEVKQNVKRKIVFSDDQSKGIESVNNNATVTKASIREKKGKVQKVHKGHTSRSRTKSNPEMVIAGTSDQQDLNTYDIFDDIQLEVEGNLDEQLDYDDILDSDDENSQQGKTSSPPLAERRQARHLVEAPVHREATMDLSESRSQNKARNAMATVSTMPSAANCEVDDAPRK